MLLFIHREFTFCILTFDRAVNQGFLGMMFQQCKQDDSLAGLTSGSRSCELLAERMHRRYEIIYTRLPTSGGQSHSYGQSWLASAQRVVAK